MTTPIQIGCPKKKEDLVVLVNHDQADLYLDELRRRFPDVRLEVKGDFAELDKILDQLRPDCVLSFRMPAKGPFPRSTLLEHDSIRWLHATGAGIEHLPPWDAKRIMVTNSSGLHTDIMAQYAAWAVLNQSLRIPTYSAQQVRREWKLYPVDNVRGKTAAIIGIGKVGRAVAAHLHFLGMHVIGVRRHPGKVNEADETYTMIQLPEVVERADFVILVTPLTEETRGLFDEALLRRFKKGAHLINLARGGIVDEDAMRKLMAEGHIASATLDVFKSEPLPREDPLWDGAGVIVTPHASGELSDWQYHAAMVFADNLEHWIGGKELLNLCDPRLGY